MQAPSDRRITLKYSPLNGGHNLYIYSSAENEIKAVAPEKKLEADATLYESGVEPSRTGVDVVQEPDCNAYVGFVLIGVG